MALTISGSLIAVFGQKIIIELYGSNALEIYILIFSWYILLSTFIKFGNEKIFIVLRGNKFFFEYVFLSALIGVLISGFSGLFLYNFLVYTLDSNLLAFIKPNIVLFFIFQSILQYISIFFISRKKPVHGILSTFMAAPISIYLIYIKFFVNIFDNFIAAYIVSILIFTPILFKEITQIIPTFKFSFKRFKQILFENYYFFFSDIINVLANKSSVFFLAYYANNLKSMVEFSIAFAFLKVSMVGINSIATVFSPHISDSIRQKDKKLTTIFSEVRVLFIIISFISFIIIFLIGNNLINYFYKDNYPLAFDLLLILQAGQIIHSFFGPISQVGYFCGKAIKVSFFKLLTTFIMVLINFIFYDTYGIFVLAYSYVFSLFLWNFMVYLDVKSILKH